MDADIQGCLNQIDKSYKAFQHNGKSLSKLQVMAVLEFGKAKGHIAVSEIQEQEVDSILDTLTNLKIK